MESRVGTNGQRALASHLARVLREPVELLGLRRLKGADRAWQTLSGHRPDNSCFGRHVGSDTGLRKSGDREPLDVRPLSLAFRALVIAHRRWYPSLSEGTGPASLRFADAMVEDPAAMQLDRRGVS